MNSALKLKRKELIHKYGRRYETEINDEILSLCMNPKAAKNPEIVSKTDF